MTLIRALVVTAAALILQLAAGVSTAGIVTVNFDDALGGVITANYQSHGFVFSPNCHYDGFPYPGGSPGGVWFGVDGAGCESTYNPTFLGPPELMGPRMDPGEGGLAFIELSDGHPFALLSLDIVDEVGYGVRIVSSKGGDIQFSQGIFPYSFSGPDWTGIKWLLVYGGTGTPAGIDNFTARVAAPEPASLALLGIGLAGLGFSRRKR